MIPGYKVTELLHESKRFKVVRAVRIEDSVNFILKLTVQELLTKKGLKNLTDEYNHACQIESDYVIKYHALYEYTPKKWVFVQEDIGGICLAKIIPEDGFEIAAFLKIAVQVLLGLQAIHQQEIIHKDIKPSNIIINLESGCVKIIDFCSSIQLRQENQSTMGLVQEAGTLAYISPEQTGRINRNIDYRTDFYCLGIMFYELLTGKLPFSGSDAMSIIHQHIAKQPIEPHQMKESIPLFLSHIIMKLLAKNPEERYQSCHGILHDLNQCVEALQKGNTISVSELGKQDFPERFIISQKLYDRENEVVILLNAFERTTQGKAEVLLVTGHAGVGKTTLINEIQKPLISKKGYFIAGKFDQMNKDIAYSAIIQAFQGLIKQLLVESEERFSDWKAKLCKAVGNNGQLIIDVIPEVECIIGKQPIVPMLSSLEAKNRFNLIFKSFISVFTQKEHPLVLFLDDLQWADDASLELIKLFIENNQYFFLIGAYRDNEVDALHPTELALRDLKRSSVTIQKITLAPLDFLTVTRWLADTLHHSLKDIQPLAELVYQKTQGNPFFIKVFLQALYDEKLLAITNAKTWSWDLQHIVKRQSTDNVGEFMVSCIHQLPGQIQELLSLASCFGNHVTLNLLSMVAQKNEEQIFQDLQVVLNMGMIYQVDDSIYFAHDRVQEAAYSLLSEENKKQTHLLIGRFKLNSCPTLVQSEVIFDIVDHINKSWELVQDDQERMQLAKLNLEAGKKAKNTIAYKNALSYLNASLNYLKHYNIWIDDYPLALALHKEVAEVEYLNGNFEKSYSLIQQMLTFIKNPIDRAEINTLLFIQKTLQGNYLEAINIGRRSLEQFGIELAEIGLNTTIQRELVRVQEQLQNRDFAALLHLPIMIDLEKKAAIKLLANLAMATYMADPILYFATGLKMVSLSLQFGHVPESCIGYAAYGALLCSLDKYQLGYEFSNLGLQLSEKFHSLQEKSQCQAMSLFFIYSWVKPLFFLKELEKELYQTCLDLGEIRFAGYVSGATLATSFYRGDFLVNIASKASSDLAFANETKNQANIDTTKAIQFTLNGLMNPLPKAANAPSDLMDHSDFEVSCLKHNSFLQLCGYQTLKAQVLYLMGQFDQALDSILNAQKNLVHVSAYIITAIYNEYYSLILLKLYPKQDEATQKKYLAQLEKNQKQLSNWANSCPENFLHQYTLIEAEIAYIKCDFWEALNLYNQAIKLAHKNKFIQDEALANELAADFCRANHQGQFAKDYIQKAHALYKYWGATAKAQQLEKAYPQLLHIFTIPKVLENLVSGNDETYINLDRLKLQTVLKASQIISSEIDLAKFLETMMMIIVEHAGAEKGTFLAVEEEQITVMAQSHEQLFDLKPISLNDWQNGSLSIIHYINRIKKPLIIDNAFENNQLKKDDYIQKQQTKSVLGIPIIIKGILKAILYLENNLMPNAFTIQHLEILTILTNQIAISFDNVNLYETMKAKVAESKKANTALQKSERRYRTLAETAHAVVWSANNEGHFITPQETWEKFTGQSWEHYQGLGWITAIYADDQERLVTALKHAISAKAYFHELVRVWSQDGYYKYLILHAVPLMNEKDEIVEWMGTCLDIHALKQTEEQLRTVTHNLNLALSSANIGTWSWDLVSSKVDIDENIFALFDIDPSHYHHTYAEILLAIHPDDRDRVDNLVKRCIAEHIDYETEYRILKKDRSIRYIAARGKVYYQENRPQRMMGLAWDITLEKEHQHLQEAKIYRQKLEEFIDTICHELRNPLTGIYGSGDLLRNNMETIEDLLKAHYENLSTVMVERLGDNFRQVKEQLDTLETCAQQQKVIVNDVLDLSKLDNDKIELVPAPFDLKILVHSILQMINPQIVQKKLTVEVELPQDECLLKADAQRLSQIILNFLTNAIKFTQEGSITIIASIQALPSQEALLSMAVKDTGIGMTLEEQSRLFERFSQASRTTSKEYGGSGLGLVISKKLIEKMGGKIEVESKKWHGSQFNFTIKCHTLTAEEKLDFYNATKKRSLSQEEVLNTKITKTILVVEDNIINQKILVKYLEQKGCVCQTANDGIEALSKCEQLCFDLIFMDIEMPRMNGLEATRWLRAEGNNKETPIIGLSGNIRKEQREEALKIGMSDYLTKPYQKMEVYKIIDKYLQVSPPIKRKASLEESVQREPLLLNPLSTAPSAMFWEQGIPISSDQLSLAAKKFTSEAALLLEKNYPFEVTYENNKIIICLSIAEPDRNQQLCQSLLNDLNRYLSEGLNFIGGVKNLVIESEKLIIAMTNQQQAYMAQEFLKQVGLGYAFKALPKNVV